MDVDTSHMAYAFREGQNDAHVHNYNKRYNTSRLNFFDLIDHKLHNINQDVPAGTRFILVDENQFGAGIVSGRRVFPFIEKDGQYWGPPADDEQAVRELERLRQAGARYIVFAQHASWWLDYYPGLREYLRSNFRIVGNDMQMIAFDLCNGATTSAEAGKSAE